MQAHSRKIFAIAGIGLGVIVLGMIWSLVNTALASIQKNLFASVLQLQWMMNCFGIFICVPLLTMGKLGDAYGRKKLFLCGLGVALLASAIGGFATRIEFLIACMGLFGLAGSMILPLSQALLVHQFPEHQKGKAIALWSIFASLSLACGPIVGGLILNWLNWHWIYWIDIPLIAVAIAMVYFFVDKEKEFDRPHCDWIGVGLLALIVGSLIMGIMQGPNWGWSSPIILTLFAIWLISLVLFILLERKTKTPLFRPDLFSNRSFLFSAIPNGCTIGFLWVSVFTIPLYLQNMLRFSPLETGFCLLLITLPVFFFSVTVSKWQQKWGAKPLIFRESKLLGPWRGFPRDRPRLGLDLGPFHLQFPFCNPPSSRWHCIWDVYNASGAWRHSFSCPCRRFFSDCPAKSPAASYGSHLLYPQCL